jgi:hypothetical protein
MVSISRLQHNINGVRGWVFLASLWHVVRGLEQSLEKDILSLDGLLSFRDGGCESSLGDAPRTIPFARHIR